MKTPLWLIKAGPELLSSAFEFSSKIFVLLERPDESEGNGCNDDALPNSV
jgi:hypothetical protein